MANFIEFPTLITFAFIAMKSSAPTLEVNAVSIVNGRITELGAVAPDGTPRWRMPARAAVQAARAGVGLVAVPLSGDAAEICIDCFDSDHAGEPVFRTVIDKPCHRVLHGLPRLPILH